MKNFFRKILYKLHRSFIFLLQKNRVLYYRLLSWNSPVLDQALRYQPVLLQGDGEIHLAACSLGVWPSPYFLNGYIHIEARLSTASINIANGVCINNNAVFIAEREKISIAKDTLIGTEFTVYDSDFHCLNPSLRISGIAKTAPVSIGENVFIGSRVTILKGVTIGNNSVITYGSVVTSSIPENCIAGGIPAKVIRLLSEET